MVPETVSGFCLVFKSGVCPNVNVCSPSNEKRKRKKMPGKNREWA